VPLARFTQSHRLRVIAAFTAIYLIWGSTYLGIKVAIDSMPPFFMAGTRFALAGLLMLAWLALRGHIDAVSLSGRRLALAVLVGTLMLGVGNGLVVAAINRGAPTGLVAVLIATTPFWLVVLERLFDSKKRITGQMIAGLALGFAGIIILKWNGPSPSSGANPAIDAITLGTMLLATLAWASGSLISKRLNRPAGTNSPEEAGPKANPLVGTALQMLAGGAVLGLFGLATESWSTIDFGAITLASWMGYAYLIVFGSIIGYTAFIWLLRHVSAAAVGTYAYVNPVVAVVLGVWFAGEVFTIHAAIASALILGAVVMLTLRPSPAPSR